MSYFITTEILCDVQGCGNSIEGAGGHSVRKIAANKKAKFKGWKLLENGDHYCPECWKDIKDPINDSTDEATQ